MEAISGILIGIFLGTVWCTAIYIINHCAATSRQYQKVRRCELHFFDQSDVLRCEKVRCRIRPEGVYIGTYEPTEFIPMERVARAFIYPDKI